MFLAMVLFFADSPLELPTSLPAKLQPLGSFFHFVSPPPPKPEQQHLHSTANPSGPLLLTWKYSCQVLSLPFLFHSLDSKTSLVTKRLSNPVSYSLHKVLLTGALCFRAQS